MQIQSFTAPLFRQGKRLWTVLGGALLVAHIALRLAFPDPVLDIRLTARSAEEQRFRLFYAHGQNGFSEQQSIYLREGISPEGGLLVYHARLKTSRPITNIRLDPPPSQHSLKIGSLRLQSKKGALNLSGRELTARASTAEGLSEADASDSEASTVGNATAVFRITSGDPYWVIPVPESVTPHQGALQARALSALKSLWVPVLGLLVLMWAQRIPLKRRYHAVHGLLAQWGDSLSRHTAARLGPGAIFVMLAIPLAFSISVGLKLHNSSLGMWYGQHGTSQTTPLLEYGEPQEIRSDEWFVYTPWLLNQVQTGMKTFNPNIGPDGATLVTGMPVIHPTAVAQPQFWGFMVFGLERGFSWHWSFRAFSLIGSVFVLLLLLTRGQTAVSLAGSLAIFGSSYVQWWYSSWLTEIITGMAGALIGVFVWTHSKNPKFIYGAALLAALSGMHVVLQPYLPFLASMAILGAFIATTMVWESHRNGLLRLQVNHRFWAIAFASVVFMALFWSYYSTARFAIEGIMNTVYPGKRVVLGGNIPVNDYLMGLFEFWRNKYEYPEPPLNPSEVSRFVFLFPFVALMVVALGRRVTFGPVFWGVLIYCALAVTWMTVPLPAGARATMAAMGLEYIPPIRMYAGLGVASWLLTAMAFARFAEQAAPKRVSAAWVVAVALMTILWAWNSLQPLNVEFYTVNRLLIALAVVGLLVWAVCRGNKTLFLAGVLLAIYMPLKVNPITSGLTQLLDKALFQQTKELDPAGKEQWVVFGGSDLSQALRANGHHVVSGVYFVPRFDIMRAFDPTDQYQSIWNNYGSVGIEAADDPSSITFKKYYEDSRALKVHPCHPSLLNLGVTRWVFTERQDLAKLTCLQELRAFEPIDVFVYGLKPPAH